ncbi:hypothetical protein [Aquisalimonas sp.]|uniref:hypothetical protein n=1 Tax=Aquisalimonas sp. TaxID=1872621 RepID=UPI0025C2D9B3|nr:hypothetical protein [Aquisalimonas sp.]
MSGSLTVSTSNEWGWLVFDAADVRALLEHSLACTAHRPTPDQMLETRYRRDGAAEAPRGTLPPMEDVAVEAIPAGLHVVVGQGLYLESNGLPQAGAERLFAPGCKPAVDADWGTAVARVGGVEEQVLFLPADAVEEVLREADDRVWLGLRRDEERFGVEEYGLAPCPYVGTE